MIDAKNTNRPTAPSDSIYQYFQALQRLVDDKPIRLPKGAAINLNSVALEAGKSAGSIKRQRPVYHNLILEVKRYAAQQSARPKSQKKVNESIQRWKNDAERWKTLYHKALARELMLLHQLDVAEHHLRNAQNVYKFQAKADT